MLWLSGNGTWFSGSASARPLVVCVKVIALSYGGTERPSGGKPNQQALWDAMKLAYETLGITHTGDLDKDYP